MIECADFRGSTIRLILNRINKELEGCEIISIETVRTTGRVIQVRVWWTL